MIAPAALLSILPYSKSFLLVDEFIQIDERKISGKYTFHSDNPVYNGHFAEQQVIPGVIAVEAMGQVGLVGHAFALVENPGDYIPILHEINAQFHEKIPVGKPMITVGELIYFRNKTIKSSIKMMDEAGLIYVTLKGLLMLSKVQK